MKGPARRMRRTWARTSHGRAKLDEMDRDRAHLINIGDKRRNDLILLAVAYPRMASGDSGGKAPVYKDDVPDCLSRPSGPETSASQSPRRLGLLTRVRERGPRASAGPPYRRIQSLEPGCPVPDAKCRAGGSRPWRRLVRPRIRGIRHPSGIHYLPPPPGPTRIQPYSITNGGTSYTFQGSDRHPPRLGAKPAKTTRSPPGPAPRLDPKDDPGSRNL